MKALYIKDWAYVGVALFLLTAIVAHVAHRDPPLISVLNLFFLGLLVVSIVSLRKLLAQ